MTIWRILFFGLLFICYVGVFWWLPISTATMVTSHWLTEVLAFHGVFIGFMGLILLLGFLEQKAFPVRK